MNWTGGGLSRHSRNASSSITQRQKQHFAKARSSLLNGNIKRSPIKWTFFEAVGRSSSGDKPQLVSTSRSQSHNQQTKTQNHISLSRVPYHEFGIDFPLRAPPLHSDRHHTPMAKHKDDPSSKLETENPLGIDNASHLRVLSPRSRTDNVEIHGYPGIEKGVSLEERRRHILCKGDWVGANIQRPIKLKYTGAINNERIGKRRRIGSGDQPHLGAIREPTNSHTLPVRNERAGPGLNVYDNLTAGPHIAWATNTKNRVRISIGGKQVHAGAGSSTTHHVMSSQTSTSDVMLLDGEDMSRKFARASAEFQGQHVVDCLNATRGDGPSRSPMNNLFHTPHPQKITSSDASTRSYVQSNNHNIRQNQVPQVYDAGDDSIFPAAFKRRKTDHAPSQSIPAGPRSASMENPYEIRHTDDDVESSPLSGQFISDISKQISESARKLQSKARDKARRHRHLSSRPQLLHPMPQTLRTAHVLHSPPSEGMGSTIAQIGTAKPIVPPCQELEEQVWKTWVLPLYDDIMPDKIEKYDDQPNPISPGISAIVNSSVRENVDQSVEKISKGDKHLQEIGPQVAAVVEYDIEVFRKNEANASSTERARLNFDENMPNIEAFDYKKTFMQRPKRITPLMKTKRHDNPDDAWMKFILSDNDKDDGKILEDNAPDQDSTPLGTLIQHDNSSMIARTSNEALSATQSQISTSFYGAEKAISERDTNSRLTAATLPKHDYMSNTPEQGSTLSSDSISLINSQPPHIVSNRQDTGQLLSSRAYVTVTPPAHRIIFTRPQRYTGRPGASNDPEAILSAEGTVTHIGSTLHARDGMFFRGGRKRGGVEQAGEARDTKTRRQTGANHMRRKVEQRDIYSLESSSEVEDVEEEEEEEEEEIDDVESSGD